MQLVHTAALPPRWGRAILANMGCSKNNKNALTKIAAANGFIGGRGRGRGARGDGTKSGRSARRHRAASNQNAKLSLMSGVGVCAGEGGAVLSNRPSCRS